MTESRALNRLGFRFKQALGTPTNSFKIYQEDIDALQSIGKYIEEMQKKQMIDYELFGKMYVYLYGEFVTYYNATALDEIPQKELNKLLNKDFNVLVHEVADRLNLSELENVIKKDSSIKNYEPMTYDDVFDNFKIMITSAINQFSPKKLVRT